MMPYRVCCGEQHIGPVCKDDKVMCCYCFERVPQKELAIDDGDKIDVCLSCWTWEQDHIAEREKFYEDHEGSI